MTARRRRRTPEEPEALGPLGPTDAKMVSDRVRAAGFARCTSQLVQNVASGSDLGDRELEAAIERALDDAGIAR